MTTPLPVDVAARLDSLASAVRRDDALTLIDALRRITGLEPHLWKGIVSFGEYSYRYESGHSGTAPAAGFAPRSTSTVIYLPDGVGTYEPELARLGPHKTGVGCLYISRLDRIDQAVLDGILARSFATVTSGTFPRRAREGGSADSTGPADPTT